MISRSGDLPALTVLGSGGPIADPHRVSAGYVVSIDGKPRIIVDPGGGSFERMGRSGLDLSSLEQILLTHLHIDHSGDLPALIMHLYMTDRKRPIAITGPAGRSGNDAAPENASPQPGAIEFVRLLFGTGGAWRYMNTFEGFGVSTRETPSEPAEHSAYAVPLDRSLEDLDVSISAVGVPHGMMPAVAFRIQFGGSSIVFSGDISRPTPAFIELARNCSILVQDFALPERETPHGHLHAKPSAVGRIARESDPHMLLLTHFMPAIENELEAAIQLVREQYSGRIEVAEDLKTYPVP